MPSSYKEDEEDGETDPDEVIEAGWTEPSEEDPNRNVIEKVQCNKMQYCSI